MGAEQDQITMLLQQVRSGDREAESALLDAVYDQLHRIAQHQLRGERSGHTLQPTALVSELYLRLKLNDSVNWADRAHFFAVAAKNMRRILIDQARARNAQRRPPPNRRVELEKVFVYSEDRSTELLALNEALERLTEFDPRQAKIVELRFFAGLTVEETASVLGLAERTVKRDWNMARAWLSSLLNEPNQGADSTPP